MLARSLRFERFKSANLPEPTLDQLLGVMPSAGVEPARAAKSTITNPKGYLPTSATARRPTFAAAPILLPSERWAAMTNRGTVRNRELMDMIKKARDYNPDVAKGVDNYVTLANPGYDLKVYKVNTSDAEGQPVPDEEGLRLVQQFCVRMFSEYSGAWDEVAGRDSVYPGLDSFIDMCHLMLATYGAFAAEVELTENMRDIFDAYPVDPTIVDFRMNEDTNRLEPGLLWQGSFAVLDPVKFRYFCKNPDPFQPGGRPPLLAVMDTMFFQQQFLRELQAVVHMTNSPRMDISVLNEAVDEALQAQRPDLMDPGMEDARKAYMDGILTDLQTKVSGLQVDDAFIHWDSVECQFIAPTGVAIPVDQIMAAIDKMMVSGLKQLPLLLGRAEGSTTTHATVQWQVYIEQLRGYQKISAAAVSWVLNLYLRLHGRQSYVALTYKKHRTSDALMDAQALNVNVLSWQLMESLGFCSHDEAAWALLDHKAYGPALAPVVPVGGASGPGGGDNTENQQGSGKGTSASGDKKSTNANDKKNDSGRFIDAEGVRERVNDLFKRQKEISRELEVVYANRV